MDLEAIRTVCDQHNNRWMAMPGVTAVGVGRDSDTQNVGITIWFESEQARAVAAIPRLVDGILVECRVGSILPPPYRARRREVSAGAPVEADGRDSEHEPMVGGI